jgi:superfamily II DNA/RNA helicase
MLKIQYFLKEIFKKIFKKFLRKKVEVSFSTLFFRLVNLFGLLKCAPLGLHAQMHQKARLKNLERFSGNDRGFLIATDVAARGLDIPDVEHVVHYQVPRTSEVRH